MTSPDSPRTIAAVTVGRSDYGIYRPILRRIVAEPRLNLHLVVAGMHLVREFGLTAGEIEADGFAIDDRVVMTVASDQPEGTAASIGLGVTQFGACFARRRPDIVLVLGDRFEMHAAAVAAVPFNLPLAHVHGGELSHGSIDEVWRHSITKLSHLHFVSTEEHGRRVVGMGEEPWRVTVSGAPALDEFREAVPLSLEDFHARHGASLDPAPLLVTFHPPTREPDAVRTQASELLAALEDVDEPCLFTAPNADAGGRLVAALVQEFVSRRPRAALVPSLGAAAYSTAMSHARAMVGNSSSGIVEAASFALPVVNVGSRQEGRHRAPNVIDVAPRRESIRDGLRRALDPAFRETLRGMVNPYGDGRAAERIVARLRDVEVGPRLLVKRFHERAWSGEQR
jgi:UDP-hydrolysing UDP-N-acetyl-D-glucosamine 2-epimerase